MQTDEAAHPRESEVSVASNFTVEEDGGATAVDDSKVVDISGKNFDFTVTENAEDAEAMYVYKNVFSLFPKSTGSQKRLKTVEFFGNEMNLFPPSASSEFESLECLRVRISSPKFDGLPLNKLKGLKEVELSKKPPRPQAMLQMLKEISQLKGLTKLSVCHFSIRYLPPEIGFLNKLEHLDLSFNKMNTLPAEISNLNALVSLKVANNELVNLPSSLSSLQKLEHLDLSNNRLTSLGSLQLDLMHKLQNLYLQFNKLPACCHIPTWINYKLEGNNGEKSSNRNQSSGSPTMVPSRSLGRWQKRQRPYQGYISNIKKSKGLDPSKLLPLKEDGEGALVVTKDLLSRVGQSGNVHGSVENTGDEKDGSSDSSSASSKIRVSDSYIVDKRDSCESDVSSTTPEEVVGEEDEGSSSDSLKITSKHKGKSDGHPKKRKDRTNSDNEDKKEEERIKISRYEDSSNLSWKYSNTSFCSDKDEIPDGFYDAGRDKPFMPLTSYDKSFHPDSREVLLVDRQRDEELDAILISAKALVSDFKKLNSANTRAGDQVDAELHIASLLALFVSDHFGGTARGALIERTRNAVASHSLKPFVCTCRTGNSESVSFSTKPVSESVKDTGFSDLCEKYLHVTKTQRNSIIVPIGSVQFGMCRHRALLLKYLCDRMEPPLPCELVRGYLDFMPHAWNVILIGEGASQIRMVVDACRPRDIRKETDPEYYSRYIPMSRIKVSLPSGSSLVPTSSFPSLHMGDGTLNECVKDLIPCKHDTHEAIVKMRTFKACGTSMGEIRKFEYNCLGEVRILAALKHPCIVEMYGHRMRSKWVPSVDGSPEHRILQSEILMEYITGGSLQSYIKQISKAGEKHVPVELALCIAKEIACALVELHSKHIIHRDIKSENILIDLDHKRADGTPVVKLCDFDSAVPLRSHLHTCAIAHVGTPPADVCVGTTRWMAPEVFRSMDQRNVYGLEVDIWSFGCMLWEMLILKVPYWESSDLEIRDLISRGIRPKLTDELEALVTTQAGAELEETDADIDRLRFLIDLFYKCTEENPQNRPTADNLYKLLLKHSSTLANSAS